MNFSTSFWLDGIVIPLLYRTFKEKLKIQGHRPFMLGFGFTTTCIINVNDNGMKSGTN